MELLGVVPLENVLSQKDSSTILTTYFSTKTTAVFLTNAILLLHYQTLLINLTY